MGHRSLPGAAVRCVSQCQVIFSITVLGGYGAAPAAVAALARREAAGSAASSKKAHRACTFKLNDCRSHSETVSKLDSDIAFHLGTFYIPVTQKHNMANLYSIQVDWKTCT